LSDFPFGRSEVIVPEVAQMIAPYPSKPKRERISQSGAPRSPDLPFRIELWNEQGSEVERVVARAYSASLAQAIFKAACEQYPGRQLSLWHGRERIAQAE
jgi:hypothetical protein